ncbi:MAG TPA: ferritin-like domain-containing protein [Polyangiaceae bacterium]|jgi:hypothetical protein
MRRPSASATVRDEWLRRVEAEYRSAAVTQHLTLWLIQLGASPDLVRAGLRIAGDEMTHASMSHTVYRAAGGEGGPQLPRESLELYRTPGAALEEDVVRVGVEVFCLGETVAVRLFKELRQTCDVPVARRALDRVLRDEVRHRDFGWVMLGWLVDAMGERIREVASRELPRSFGRLEATYAPREAEGLTRMPREDARWGLMAAARYGEVLRATLRRDYVPRFRRLGIDALAAWDVRAQAGAGPT